MAEDSQVYITSKEFLVYMDGFRKEILGRVDKIDESFRTFELGTVTRLNAEVATLRASHEVLKAQVGGDKKLEEATYGPTQKIVSETIRIILTAVLVTILGLILINNNILNI